MRTLSPLTALLVSLTVMTDAQAFKKETHRRMAIDAVDYMRRHPDTTQYATLLAGVTRAGYSIEQFAEALGQGAADVDDFADTYLCGAITGRCASAPARGVAGDSVNYTSFWHFQNRTQGRDVHGNVHGGYNYARLTMKGDIDRMAAAWLKGDHLDDGRGGMRGWFGDGSKYDSFGLTEANYRQGSHSTARMYADFETAPFQPIDHLAQYWWSRFMTAPTVQSLGFVMHATDVLQPHHTWTTMAHHHRGFETWVRDYYDRERLNDDELVSRALTHLTPLPAKTRDIRVIVQEGGRISYEQGGAVLSTTGHDTRRAVGRIVVPHSIAMIVRLLDAAAGRL